MMNLAVNDHRLAKPGSENAALRDYDSVRRAIAFISEHWRAQPTIEAMADAASVTPDELHLLFRRWAGLTPKAFMQALTLDHAKGLLRDSASVLDAALDSGLSVAGRVENRRRRHDAAIRISSLAVRHRDRDRLGPRPRWPRFRRSGRGAGCLCRHAAALAARHLP
jgi:AraC family transcriptional regulator of adaptative response/methylated-DNA-[protein]-cysteine methyltransferase